jgi:hypothetical protein
VRIQSICCNGKLCSKLVDIMVVCLSVFTRVNGPFNKKFESLTFGS